MDAAGPTPVHLRAVINGLAVNTALPPAAVRRLVAWRHGWGKVAERPDLTDTMIEEIIRTDEYRLLHSLALNRHLPDPFRIRLAAHPDKDVRSALAGRAAPRRVLEMLVDDPEQQVREALAGNRDAPPDLRAQLAADADPEVRAHLARHWAKAPEDVRRILLTDSEPRVRKEACPTHSARRTHPKPPEDLLETLLADPVTRAGVVIHTVLTPDTLACLIRDPDHDVRAALAGHPDLPAAARAVLAEDPALTVRVSVFARPDTPEDLRARIHTSVRELARALTDPGPDADPAARRRFYSNAEAPSEMRVLHLRWVTEDPLPHIDSPYVSFRFSAALSDSLPAQAVARLLEDPSELVRLTAAHSAPHLVDPATAEGLERAYPTRQDPFTLWWDDAQVLAFPPEYLRRFATDADPRLRSFAPRDPDLPTDLAEKLAGDPHERVRRAVAGHRNLPLPALLRLLADPTERVAEAAGASPFLPAEHMNRLLRLAGV